MKIVHVSNFTMTRNGGNYGTIEYKLSNGLTRLGHHVVPYCDRDIARSYFAGIKAVGRRHANEKLIAVCDTVRPDFLLIGHADLISPATLKVVRRRLPGIRIAHWNCDSLSFSPKNLSLLKSLAPVADATFVTTAGDALKQIADCGGRAAYMPNPVDSSIESGKAFEQTDLENDLVFVGRPDPERIDICNRIRAQLPDLKFAVHGLLGKPRVQGATLQSILARSKMGLALSRPNDAFLYSSDRMAQLMGNGVLTFVDGRAGFEAIFRPDELVFYNGVDDLIAKIAQFKSDDALRREIASRGWKKVHACFSETLVSQWILDVTFGHSPSRSYAWPTDIF